MARGTGLSVGDDRHARDPSGQLLLHVARWHLREVFSFHGSDRASRFASVVGGVARHDHFAQLAHVVSHRYVDGTFGAHRHFVGFEADGGEGQNAAWRIDVDAVGSGSVGSGARQGAFQYDVHARDSLACTVFHGTRDPAVLGKCREVQHG